MDVTLYILRHHRLFIALIMLIPITLVLPTHATPIWSSITVDAKAALHHGLSLAVDSNNIPHMVYIDSENGLYYVPGTSYKKVSPQQLKYASLGSSGWDIQTVDSFGETELDAGNAGNVGCSALAFDINDTSHIVYNDRNHLKYAVFRGANWTIQIVDRGSSGSLALDSGGNPHISYKGENGSLRYATWTGIDWAVQTIFSQLNGSGEAVAFQYLALDSNDIPSIIYCLGYGSNSTIMWAQKDSSVWAVRTAVSNANNTRLGNVVFDSSSYPRFIYFNDWNRSLMYESWNGSSWNGQTVAAIDPVFANGGFMRLDSYGNAHVSYSLGAYQVLYGQLMESGWNSQIVDGDSVVLGFPVPLAIDSRGNPHICYMALRGSSGSNFVAGTVRYATIIQSVQTPSSSPSESPQPSPTFSPLPSETAPGFPADTSWIVASAVAVAVAAVALIVLLRLMKSRKNLNV